ncbi:hypothetical protein ACIPW5_38565 [Streptomyces sp. NPDC090077]|uniref:hypothetical protein n=1 Tax=Streptomyces sp. NPDC090077 TaxID=3365938 RepID=UPI0037FA9BF2
MSPSPAKAPALLLIDIENTIGANAHTALALARLDALLHHAKGTERVIAACARPRIRADLADGLRKRGVHLLLADTDKNAADRLLTEQAHAAAADGTRRFVVASADAGFAPLAALGHLEVLAWRGRPISKALEKAGTVRRLPHIRRTALPAQPAPPSPEPAPLPATPATPDAQTAEAAPGGWPATKPPHVLRWIAGGAAALFCGGLAFGAGTALGNHITHSAWKMATRKR